MACYPYPVYMWGSKYLGIHDDHRRTQLSTSYVSIFWDLAATRLKCEYAYSVRVIVITFYLIV